MWGNHDWKLIKCGITISQDLWAGRFTSGLVQQFLGGDLLPIVNNLFCFAGFTFAVIYLAKYWKIPQTPIVYTLFGLFVILMPYTLSWLWYIKQTTLYWNIFFVVYALYISQKKTCIGSIMAIILMVVSLGAYASVISTIAVILLSRVLMDILLEQKSIKELFHIYWRTGINIIVSIVIFKLILTYYESIGRLKHGAYNTDYITISELPQKLKTVLVAVAEMFYVFQPYISTPYKIFITLPMLYVFYVLLKNKPLKIIQGVLLLIAVLISGQLTNLMAKADFSYTVRINFFSQPYIWALFMAIGLRGKKWIRSACLIIMSVALWMNIISDIRYQKVHYLASKAEMPVYADIINRIKQNEKFNPNGSYKIVTSRPLSGRKNLYKYNDIVKTDDSLYYAELIPAWNEKEFYDFFERNSYIEKHIGLAVASHVASLSLSELKHIAGFILNEARPYPHKNSVFVDDKYIYVIYDEDRLNQAKRNIQARLKELEKKHE